MRPLLDNGADINRRAGTRGTVLQMELEGGHEKVVRVLLDNGAEVDTAAATDVVCRRQLAAPIFSSPLVPRFDSCAFLSGPPVLRSSPLYLLSTAYANWLAAPHLTHSSYCSTPPISPFQL